MNYIISEVERKNIIELLEFAQYEGGIKEVLKSRQPVKEELQATISEQANTIAVLKNANREIAEWNAELKKTNKYHISRYEKLIETAQKLTKEIEELKRKLTKAEKETSIQKSLAEAHHRLEKRYEDQLTNQPKLNRQEINKIVDEALDTLDIKLKPLSFGNIVKETMVEKLLNLVPEQKYLNRQEVEHIIGSINCNEEKVTAILNLAIPVIDKDRIVKVLKQYSIKKYCSYFNGITEWKELKEEYVANEIIGEVGE